MPANARRQPAKSAATLTLDGDPLPIADLVAIARRGQRVTLGRGAVTAMNRSRGVVERALRTGAAHYGINTGFGSLAKQRIGPDDLRALQRNLIRSHSAGVGKPLRPELVRAIMLVLAASLARGLSGVRPVVVETILAMLNKQLTPIVPSVGSVGASGDLAPLAAIALALTGEGEVTTSSDQHRPSAAAMSRAGIKPLVLEAKEGLALINGTHLMCAEGALLVHDARRLFDAAVTALAMSIDACRATHAFLDPRLYAARNHATLGRVANQLRSLLAGSRIATSHLEDDPRVQDPYSLRAGPTILGGVLEALDGIEAVIANELGAVTDNPLVFSGARPAVLSGANFHGLPLALPLDYLAIALGHLAGVSERRTYLITGAFEPESHLKPFLAPQPGLQSGLMIAQYTAAACVNELIGLATPASVANIPTCAGMEDYNSFGPRSAAKARRGIELAQHVVAIELLCAAQGLEHHRPLRSGAGVERAFAAIRRAVPTLKEDRPLTQDIEAIARLVHAGVFAAE
jgi:histidine ammonia-lyase